VVREGASASVVLKILLTLGFLQFVTMLVMMVRTKALALLLGPEQVGVMAIIDKLLAVVSQTLSFSLPYAAVRFLPELSRQDPAAFQDLCRRMRNFLVTLSLAATAAGIAVTALRPELWGPELLPYRPAVLAAFLGLPVVSLVPFLGNAIAGRLEPHRSMLFTLSHALLAALAILGVTWGGLPGLYVTYAALGLALVVVVARRVVTLPAASPPRGERRAFAIGLPPRIWRFSLALFGLTFVAPYVAWYVHYEVLRHYGADAAGWMQAAIGISLAVRGVLGAAHQVFLTPQVNRGGSAEERMRWTDEFHRTLCFLCGSLIPPIVLFPHLVVRLLYSTAFLPGARFVVLFVMAETITLLSGTYQGLVVALDHLPFHVAQNVAAQLLVLGIASVVVVPYGVGGAGFAILLAPTLLYGGTTLFLWRRHGLRMPRRNAFLALFVLVSLAIAGIVGVVDSRPGWSAVPAKVAVYALLVAALARFLTAEDWTRLVNLAADARATAFGALPRRLGRATD
jgi:PST family polysaccharide transporter